MKDAKGRFTASALTVSERFWAKVDKGGLAHPKLGTPCWMWTASKNKWGYGHFSVNGRLVKAPRFALEMEIGSIPAGLMVCHRCDNPPCVNPAHLFIGTNTDNQRDSVSKGRFASRLGERNANHRLTAEIVTGMRIDYLLRRATKQQIADRSGMSRSHSDSILAGRKWQHVPMPGLADAALAEPSKEGK